MGASRGHPPPTLSEALQPVHLLRKERVAISARPGPLACKCVFETPVLGDAAACLGLEGRLRTRLRVHAVLLPVPAPRSPSVSTRGSASGCRPGRVLGPAGRCASVQLGRSSPQRHTPWRRLLRAGQGRKASWWLGRTNTAPTRSHLTGEPMSTSLDIPVPPPSCPASPPTHPPCGGLGSRLPA